MTSQPKILLAVAAGEDDLAAPVVNQLESVGFSVAHRGNFLVGDSIVGESNKLLSPSELLFKAFPFTGDLVGDFVKEFRRVRFSKLEFDCCLFAAAALATAFLSTGNGNDNGNFCSGGIGNGVGSVQEA